MRLTCNISTAFSEKCLPLFQYTSVFHICSVLTRNSVTIKVDCLNEWSLFKMKHKKANPLKQILHGCAKLLLQQANGKIMSSVLRYAARHQQYKSCYTDTLQIHLFLVITSIC